MSLTFLLEPLRMINKSAVHCFLKNMVLVGKYEHIAGTEWLWCY